MNYENTILVKEGRKQGPSPYAFGIKVNDIKSLLHNAKSLDIDFIRKDSNQSMDVINNIDGSIYIVDHNNSNVWEKDFNQAIEKHIQFLKTRGSGMSPFPFFILV